MNIALKEPESAVNVDNWQVWAYLDEHRDPILQHESFIIGVGRTRVSAVMDALHTLKAAVATVRALAK